MERMSYYSRYSRNYNSSDWKSYMGPVAIGLVVVLVIAWGIAEFACTRTFIGTLNSKHASVTYTYDQERMCVDVDEDGDTHVTTKGDDETVAHKKYILTFFSDGEMREVTAGNFRARVPYVRREDLALAALNNSHAEPGFYTHAKTNTEYLVTVSGWLLDGTVEDLTPMDSIKAE